MPAILIEAAPGKGFSERLKDREAAVGNDIVGERPEPFGGLQLRAVGWQEDKTHTLGWRDLLARVPAGVVEDEDDGLVPAGADLFGEGLQGGLEGRRVDCVERGARRPRLGCTTP